MDYEHRAAVVCGLAELIGDRELEPRTRLALLCERLPPLMPWVVWADDIEAAAPAACVAQLLAELCNWAAKAHDDIFYALKPVVWALAVELGAEHGWGSDGAHYLSTPEGGVCCAHDPYGQLEALVPWRVWPHPWSGVRRQDAAPEIVRSARIRAVYARCTSPAGAQPTREELVWAHLRLRDLPHREETRFFRSFLRDPSPESVLRVALELLQEEDAVAFDEIVHRGEVADLDW